MNKKNLFLITFAHVVTDSFGGFIPILLPVLTGEYGYSLGLAASIPAILGFIQNFPQPFIGYYYDRTKKYLIWLSPLGASIFLGTFIFLDSYPLMLLFITLGGLSVATFHPEATHIARSTGPEKKELAVSIFLSGGTGGYALGSLICGVLMYFFGKTGLLAWVAVGVITSILLLFKKGELTGRLEKGHSASIKDFTRLNRVPEFVNVLVIVTLIVSFQSLVGTFLPSYLSLKGFGEMSKGFYSFIFVIPGSIAGIIAGKFAREKGLKALVLFSQLLGLLCLVLFMYLPHPWYLLFIPLCGAFTLSSFPALVSHSYKHLPGNAGIAGGAVIGLTWGIGGILTQFAGILAGWYGIPVMYHWLLLLPAAAAVLVLFAKI